MTNSRKGIISYLTVFALIAVTGVGVCQDSERMPPLLKSLLSDYSVPVRVGVTVVKSDGNAIVKWNQDEAIAAASAIKTAMLIELVDEFGEHIDDQVPLEDILEKDHPCIAHFSAKQQAEIRDGLEGITYRRMAKIMMGSEDASNLVYNAAANTTIAVLGGPVNVTKKLHQRSKLLEGLVVRRYMLARRDVQGDNVATSKSLCQLWKWIAKRNIPGMSDRKFSLVEGCILQARSLHQVQGFHLYKDGSLDSYPLTRTYAGAVRIGSQSFSYALLMEQPELKDKEKADAIKEFDQLSSRLILAALKAIGDKR